MENEKINIFIQACPKEDSEMKDSLGKKMAILPPMEVIASTPVENTQIQVMDLLGIPENVPSNVGNDQSQSLKMAVLPIRLSGAQKRRNRRAEKVRAGMWTRENPYWKREDEKRKSELENGSPQGFQTDFSTSSTQEQSKNCRYQPSPGRLNDAALRALRMAIIDRCHPDIILDQVKADLIQNKIIEALDQSLLDNTNPPQFESTRYLEGILWITCANDFSKQWLRQIVDSLKDVWEGADLIAVESTDLPKRLKVLVWIPGTKNEEKSVRSRLGLQNPGLKTEDWRLLNRKEENDGEIMVFSVGGPSFRFLEQVKFKAYFGLRSVIFRPL